MMKFVYVKSKMWGLTHIFLNLWVVCPFNMSVTDVVQLFKVNILETLYKFLLTCSDKLHVKVITCWVVVYTHSATMLQSAYDKLQSVATIS